MKLGIFSRTKGCLSAFQSAGNWKVLLGRCDRRPVDGAHMWPRQPLARNDSAIGTKAHSSRPFDGPNGNAITVSNDIWRHEPNVPTMGRCGLSAGIRSAGQRICAGGRRVTGRGEPFQHRAWFSCFDPITARSGIGAAGGLSPAITARRIFFRPD